MAGRASQSKSKFHLLPWSDIQSAYKHVNTTFTHTADAGRLDSEVQSALKNVGMHSVTTELRTLLANPELCQENLRCGSISRGFCPRSELQWQFHKTLIVQQVELTSHCAMFLPLTPLNKLVSTNVVHSLPDVTCGTSWHESTGESSELYSEYHVLSP